MPRVYGYMDTDTGVFTPAGQEVQYNPPQGQVAYSAYNQQPQGQQWQGQGYRANTGRQRQYQQWQGNGYRVNVGQPRYTGNGYAPRGYNTNMNYGPWYGQQSYATYPPYAPYQPRYEWMPGFNGQATAVRLGEYQREQPVAYEMMYNSQGVPVRVPVYAPMNNSARPVRIGVSPDGQPYGSANVNYQAAFPQQQQTRNVQRISTTSKSAGTNLSPVGQPSSFGAALGEQTVNNALGVSTAPSYEAPSSTSAQTEESQLTQEIYNNIMSTSEGIVSSGTDYTGDAQSNLDNPDDVLARAQREAKERIKRKKENETVLNQVAENVQYVGI